MKAKAVGWIEGDEVKWLRDRKPNDGVTLYVETPLEVEDREPIGYTLEPIYATRKGSIATAAFILCSSCNAAISGSGGPRYNAICLKCAEHLDFTNLIKGKSNG
jgi:hypothetical protein